jgi:hypothetical protein
MKAYSFIICLLSSLLALCFFGVVEAGTPLWSFFALTYTTISVPSNTTYSVQYIVTNQSKKTHTLSMQPIQATIQVPSGPGICGNPFILRSGEYCTLSMVIDGSQLTKPISDGPIVCEQNSMLQCYRPVAAKILHATQIPPI